MISIRSSGDFKETEKWLRKMSSPSIFDQLARFGEMGVDALRAATPKDSGVTANSWYYEIVKDSKSWSIVWGNRNVVNGTPVAILLQYGHGTGTGGYVQGQDYINPAMKPIFDQISEAMKEVTK